VQTEIVIVFELWSIHDWYSVGHCNEWGGVKLNRSVTVMGRNADFSILLASRLIPYTLCNTSHRPFQGFCGEAGNKV